MALALEAGAEDLTDEGERLAGHDRAVRLTARARGALEAAGLRAESRRAHDGADATVAVTTSRRPSGSCASSRLLDDHDDVQNVYANFDIPDAVMAGLRGLIPASAGAARPAAGHPPPLGACRLLSNACSSSGIDPGLSRCGYGVVDGRRGAPWPRWPVVSSPPHRTMPLPDRLHDAARRSCGPSSTSSAPRRSSSNGSSSRSTPARPWPSARPPAWPLLAAADARLRGGPVQANEVKQALVGFGGATKEQVQRMVPRCSAWSSRPRPPDVADALALAACHLTGQPLRRAVAASSRRARNEGCRGDRIAARHPARATDDGRGDRRRRRRGVPGRRSRPRCGLLGTVGSDVFLHVHTHVREDAIVLYGFAHADERRCFEALLGAHGVGPALALAILSSLSPAALSTAVLEDDVDTLCLVPGVGKKTAARLLLELKARLDLPELGGARRAGSSGSGTRRGEARGRARRARLRHRRDPRSARGRRRGRPGRGAAARSPPRAGAATDDGRGPTRGAGSAGRGSDARRGPASPGRPDRRPRRGGRGGRAPARAPSTSSSGRASSPSTSDRRSRRHGGATSRSTTCSSPGRPGSARPRWPASWPPRWASGSGSPSGPALVRAGDLAALLTDLPGGRRAVHRRDPPPATGRSRRSSTRRWRTSSSTSSSARARRRAASGSTCRRFTLVGATTRTGLVTGPLRDRFGFVARLDLLRRRRARGHRAPLGGASWGSRIDAEGAAARSPNGRGARPASPTACCGGCATSSRSGPTGRSPATSAIAGLERVRGRRARARQGRPRHPRRALPPVRRSARWASRTLAVSASARSPTPSRTSTSRTCSSRG